MTDPTNRELLQGEWHALLADPDAVVRAVREMVEEGTIEGFIEKIRPHYTHDGEPPAPQNRSRTRGLLMFRSRRQRLGPGGESL